jgi:hypothetical protein
MKKAKIVLSAIGLLSIIGGALAFKAQHKFSGHYFCYTTKAYNFAHTIYTLDFSGDVMYCTTRVGSPYNVLTKVVENL